MASSEIASRTMRWASSPSGRRCCGLAVRVLRSVSWRVHSWRLTIAFQGNSTIHSPSSIALARTTSSSAVRRATFPISLRYIRTGSSIPIMSAESASSSSAVGSSSAFSSSLAGTSTGATASATSATRPGTITVVRSLETSTTTSTSAVAMSGSPGSATRSASSSSSSSGSMPVVAMATSSATRAAVRDLGAAAFASGAAAFAAGAAALPRRGLAASTACTRAASAGSWVMVVLQLGARPAGRAGSPARGAGAARVGSRCGGRSRSCGDRWRGGRRPARPRRARHG